MSFALQYDKRQKLLVVQVGPDATDAVVMDVYAAIERFCATDGVPSSLIVDFTPVERSDISSEFVRRLAGRKPVLPPGRARAYVAPRPEIYGLARMLQILRDGRDPDINVVHTLQEAYTLLRIDPPEF